MRSSERDADVVVAHQSPQRGAHGGDGGRRAVVRDQRSHQPPDHVTLHERLPIPFVFHAQHADEFTDGGDDDGWRVGESCGQRVDPGVVQQVRLAVAERRHRGDDGDDVGVVRDGRQRPHDGRVGVVTPGETATRQVHVALLRQQPTAMTRRGDVDGRCGEDVGQRGDGGDDGLRDDGVGAGGVHADVLHKVGRDHALPSHRHTSLHTLR